MGLVQFPPLKVWEGNLNSSSKFSRLDHEICREIHASVCLLKCKASSLGMPFNLIGNEPYFGNNFMIYTYVKSSLCTH